MVRIDRCVIATVVEPFKTSFYASMIEKCQVIDYHQRFGRRGSDKFSTGLGQGGGAAGWHTDDVAQLSRGKHEDTIVSVTRKNTLERCLLA